MNEGPNVKELDVTGCEQFADAVTIKKVEKLNRTIAEYNQAVDTLAATVAAGLAGDVDPDRVFEVREKAARESIELPRSGIKLIQQRAALRAELKMALLPDAEKRRLELLEAKRIAELKAFEIWPESGAPDYYNERGKIIQQLTRTHEVRAAWVPYCLTGSAIVGDGLDGNRMDKELKAALKAVFVSR